MITKSMIEYLETKGWFVISEDPPKLGMEAQFAGDYHEVCGAKEIKELFEETRKSESIVDTVVLNRKKVEEKRKKYIEVDRQRADKYCSHTLYGIIGGGQLEFVKMEDFDRDGIPFVRLFFTNHDVQAMMHIVAEIPENEQNKLYESEYFVIEVPKHQP
jgi:hypothetical protein